jgi:hypothetical protein
LEQCRQSGNDDGKDDDAERKLPNGYLFLTHV